MKLSILICSLSSRHALLQALIAKLDLQIKECDAHALVEVRVYEDEKQKSVGEKRNQLLDDANGEFVVFIDDDDDIADDYIWQILKALEQPNIDCVGFRAMMSIKGGNTCPVIYSLQNDSQVEFGGTYYRLPGHLTPLRKTSIGKVRFSDKNLGEDADFSSTLYRIKALKKEAFIDKVLYHYRFDSATSATQAGKNPPSITGIDHSRFDIVILSNQTDNLRGCLESVFVNEPALARNRIVVVLDGDHLEHMKKEYHGVTYLKGVKPFVFARNANIGIGACPNDVILLNDDARLETKFGFSSLAWATKNREEIGLSSASINGFVGNENQKQWSRLPIFRNDARTLAFISVFIPRSTLDRVGLLDERFIGYGMDDDDECLRTRKAGLITSIYDGCVVEHNSKENKSTYRVKPEIKMLLEQNRKIFEEKWKDQK